ncbi:MAG: putative sulfate/molybdate transporter [Dehalococcoidia bacterium]|jgi:SulP family sulfate permease|nr:putative sulfate/molybdate transporter [Dehalococcoidia bacterium]
MSHLSSRTHADGSHPDRRNFRFSLFELGGALGDLGVLLPLTVALITLNHMNATSVFLVVGLAYIAAGAFYRLPMPVQPLKAVAAIAIASGLSAGVISASGLIMAAFLLILAITGLVGPMSKLFPKAIVRGIQLGVGLFLVKAGLSLVSRQEIIIGGRDAYVALADLSIPVGWILAVALAVVFLLFLRSKRIPASLALLGLGVLAGVFWGSIPGLKSLSLGLSLPALSVPTMADLSIALVLLVIPQIPLTLGNAVFATNDTAKAYFGPKADRVTPKRLLTTMGIANLGAGFLGGMPICHGSGGLTAHYRLGARTGAAGLIIGGLFVALAIFVDGNVVPILSLIPYPVLGVLVMFVGVQHGMLAKDLRSARDIPVAVLVAVVALVTTNLAIGFASGICLYLILSALGTGRWVVKVVGKVERGTNNVLTRCRRINVAPEPQSRYVRNASDQATEIQHGS